ncbi:MAG: ABC transporter permease subunit [Spirochaetaceae bacterium]|jgi:multiple sugar transport system permease protein/putative aldouronate transport system permease protein|nr:ABC transporter permease subunit [Spirochaetaceae bacterium]
MKIKRSRAPAGSWQFWLIMVLPLAYIIIFSYVPMSGVLMAFKDYSPRRGIWQSPWVGLRWFKQFLTTPSGVTVIVNTLRLGFYSLLAGFPIPILLAIGLNEIRSLRFKKTVQMVTYAPYFISTVVMVGMLMQITDLRLGILNRLLTLFGGQAVNFFGSAEIFPHLYVWSGVWQTMGYSSIIYIAALAGINKELQEAAVVDGVSRVQRIWYVDLPAIQPTVIILLIFNCGSIMSIGFEKTYLMQNSINMPTAEVISTFVYKVGLQNANYSFSTAVGLFNSLVAFGLMMAVNQLSKKLTDTSVW